MTAQWLLVMCLGGAWPRLHMHAAPANKGSFCCSVSCCIQPFSLEDHNLALCCQMAAKSDSLDVSVMSTQTGFFAFLTPGPKCLCLPRLKPKQGLAIYPLEKSGWNSVLFHGMVVTLCYFLVWHVFLCKNKCF